METRAGAVRGGNGNEVGGQMRRVHIVYFLCRNGCIEHPHLIRVHQHSSNGVHLRDVKRWLSELRGKDMPHMFAWSYKRRYKEGYVWQDLLNDDLITPICDNEYVLKGSEIPSSLNNDNNSYKGKQVFDLKISSPFEGNIKDPKYPPTTKDHSQDFSTNTSFEIEESSFDSNVTSEDTIKNQDENNDKHVIQIRDDKMENNPAFYETFINDNNNNNNMKNNSEGEKGGVKSEARCFKADLSSSYSFRKSGQKSRMFRNWITCGTANTHENAVVLINKRNGSITSTVSSVSKKNGKEDNTRQICKKQSLRGFEKSFDTNEGSKKSTKEDSTKLKTFGAAYKPVNGPNCSQCGRHFKPEKLHNHMKYCRGMKAMSKSTNSRLKSKTTRPHSPSSVSMDTFFLTNK
ncbi:hypothetical protein R6Q57_010033 [Mikania cordata]